MGDDSSNDQTDDQTDDGQTDDDRELAENVKDWMASIDHADNAMWLPDGRPKVQPFTKSYRVQLTQVQFDRLHDCRRRVIYEINHAIAEIGPRRNVLVFQDIDRMARDIETRFGTISKPTPAQAMLLKAAKQWNREREHAFRG
jgi:hypothetical protein